MHTLLEFTRDEYVALFDDLWQRVSAVQETYVEYLLRREDVDYYLRAKMAFLRLCELYALDVSYCKLTVHGGCESEHPGYVVPCTFMGLQSIGNGIVHDSIKRVPALAVGWPGERLHSIGACLLLVPASHPSVPQLLRDGWIHRSKRTTFKAAGYEYYETDRDRRCYVIDLYQVRNVNEVVTIHDSGLSPTLSKGGCGPDLAPMLTDNDAPMPPAKPHF